MFVLRFCYKKIFIIHLNIKTPEFRMRPNSFGEVRYHSLHKLHCHILQYCQKKTLLFAKKGLYVFVFGYTYNIYKLMQ